MPAKKTASDKDTYKRELAKQKSIEQMLKKEAEEFRKQFADRLLKLVTSGFGLVAALAWNELIKELIRRYIEPVFGGRSGIVSLFVYALVVTFLAVFVTYQLSRIVKGNNEEE